MGEAAGMQETQSIQHLQIWRLEDQISHAREMVEMLGKEVEKCLEGSVTKQTNESSPFKYAISWSFPLKTKLSGLSQRCKRVLQPDTTPTPPACAHRLRAMGNICN